MQEFLSDALVASVVDHAACRGLICDGSKSFYAASLVLPKAVRQPAYALYAFCRVADDAVDLDSGKQAAVARLQMRLDRAYAGRPLPDAVDRAFACIVHRYSIPRALPEALLEGLLWDAEERRYDDLSGIFDYSARVAGAVGAMMAVLMGVRAPHAVARACDLGCAMQLTNIARDVAEDAREGRLYLPQAWLREEGIEPDDWLRAPVFDARIKRLVRRLLTHADELYARAEPGIDALPLACRPGIYAARRIYAEIGRVLETQDCDPSKARAYVPTSRKLQLLGQAMVDAGRSSSLPLDAPTLPEVRFLVEAVDPAYKSPIIVEPDRAGFGSIVHVLTAMAERDHAHRVRTTRGYGVEQVMRVG
jgi:phytoene synthase